MREVLKEWFVSTPWGKIALISWGSPAGEPVLLVHGREDSAATFVPLLELLPDKYHYVGFDLPGHGMSDPYPTGVMVTRFHFMLAIEVVVKHLGWKRYVYLAHSLGSELGLFYNAIHPNEITKFIHLDAGIPLQANQMKPIREYYETSYAKYYDNYNRYVKDDRVYTRRQALGAVMKTRGLNEDQADVILSRNLKSIGEDRYKLSWDKRLKGMAPLNLPNECLLQLFTSSAPPTLFIAASVVRNTYAKGRQGADELVSDMSKLIKYFHIRVVEGNHDVHVTNPERVAGYISWFMDKQFVTSKL